MKAQHTPGPWAEEAAMSSDMSNIRYITANTKIIASVRHRVEHTQDMALANAALIAAAPELLDALAALLEEGEFNDYPNTRQARAVQAARAAIAKATGDDNA